MTDALATPEQAHTESKFWARVPENDAVCVELERGGEGLAEIWVDLETFQTEFAFRMHVKKKYGGGSYRAVMRDAVTKQYLSTLAFKCGGEPKDPDAEAEKQKTKEPDNIASLLMQMQERSDARMEKILEKIGSGTSMKDTLAMIADVQKINGSGRSSLEGLREFMEFKTLARELAGDEATTKSDGLGDLLKTFAPLLGEMTKQGTELEKIKAAVALRKAQIAAGQKPEAPAAAPTRAPLPPELLQQMDMLLSVAGVIPAEELAAMVADQMNEDEAQAVVDAIDGTDWLAQLIEQEPRAKDHAKWLETFAAKLLDLLTDEPEQPDAPAETQGAEVATGQPGHAANAATDGGANPAGQS